MMRVSGALFIIALLVIAMTFGKKEVMQEYSQNMYIGAAQLKEKTVQSVQKYSLPSLKLPAKRPASIPPLEELVHDRSVVGDVRGLLDYAILGMPKCATSHLQFWLSRHNQTAQYNNEMCDYLKSKEDAVVRKLYDLSDDPMAVRGFKCPQAWTKQSVSRFRRHFTEARLVFGVRHPVSWFKSFYDYRKERIRLTGSGESMPNATLLVGSCELEHKNVCTDRAFFHDQLFMLGKTKMTAKEMELISPHQRASWGTVKNPIFLYDVHQLGDTNMARKGAFVKDLQNFLGLTQPMPPQPNHRKQKRGSDLPICNPEYDELRKVLMEAGRKGAEWIKTYFLESKNVFVSNREFFEYQLDTWKIDPCSVNV